MRNCMIVIPVLNPNEAFLPYVEQLIKEQFPFIVIVNDGSSKDKIPIFDELSELPEVTVLTHAVNLGKGRALKNAFNYIMNEPEFVTYDGVITVDGDGQHEIDDVIALCRKLEEKNDELVLGVRLFDKENVPWTNRMGNGITKHLFGLLYGKKINDTQTGLRGLPADMLSHFVGIEGERYSYETNMLIVAVQSGMALTEIPIETVYLDDNKESHFNKVKDSVDIYMLLFKNFFKFISVSLTSFLIDLSFFQIFLLVFSFLIKRNQIITATILARGISSLFNFTLNKKWVFESDREWKQTFFSYYALVAVTAIVSGLSVYWLFKLTSIEELVLKIFIDAILFTISYRIQKSLIFTAKK
ncbi:bifunctional glycosyltransferase family 2/GtrA family protein [Alkalibacterium kapii]|uniref:Dolichol-phosphate mannosyltransferase n=1 Tax=Alkalibacterium kapii TaxID=426704 RepID=A0A511AQX7_9LACT|nr:bifunctional glycosyltransferase family 2/GtrA family protein [Alkalibacterium kapii]GEK90568.1 dolichol-phosphate mannosyltransferase [Alkalibacterium kapii]